MKFSNKLDETELETASGILKVPCFHLRRNCVGSNRYDSCRIFDAVDAFTRNKILIMAAGGDHFTFRNSKHHRCMPIAG